MTADGPISTNAHKTITRHDGVAHVTTSVADRPHVAPVFYHYESGCLYFIPDGRKLENLRANPRTAISLYEKAGNGPEDVRQATILDTSTIIDDD